MKAYVRDVSIDELPRMATSATTEDAPVAVLVLDARGLDWLIEHLPSNDQVTARLHNLRTLAKNGLWERSA